MSLTNEKASLLPRKLLDFSKDSPIIVMPENANENNGRVEKRPLSKRIPAFGLLMALMSVFCFSAAALIVKILTDLHSIEILVIRSSFQFIFYLSSTIINNYSFRGKSGHRIDLALRAISGTISLTTLYIAYRLMPLSDASTIHFASPVFVAIFAYFMLKEPLTILQAVTAIITLIGVVIISKPEFIFGSETEIIYENRLLGSILSAVGALSAAFSMICLRKLKTTPVSVVVMWYSVTVIVSGLVILVILDELVWPTGLWTWSLLVAIGFCGIGDQFFLTIALQHESAGPVSVTRTFNIVMSFIWEVALLSEAIEWTSVIGACLVSSCVIILALVKWKSENPELFENLFNKLCCCYTKVGEEESDFERILDSLSASYDSIASYNSNDTHLNEFILGKISFAQSSPYININHEISEEKQNKISN